MGAKTPAVTVLMPTYNRPAWLGGAIRSVVAQTFGDWELLVINDGGEDVRRIVEESGDPRVRYIAHTANRGKAACLNEGLRAARGDLVAYLDDDDLWYPRHLELLTRALADHPEAGAAYSDLYEVVCLKGADGRRVPLQKRIQVCRDYNRMFMFHFNHVFHVSLAHRRDLALRAGGYDENVRVMIDWDLARKLSFFTDFIHVSAITGEYYVPLRGSDRISDVQRTDEAAYRQNLRRIRADLPPEPWPMVDRVAVVYPAAEWGERTREVVAYFADALAHPCRIVLVNRDRSLDEAACRRALGALGELRHVAILPASGATVWEAALAGARSIQADLYYLPSEHLDRTLQLRLLAGVAALHETGCDAIRWESDGAAGRPYDVLITRPALLRGRRPLGERTDLDVRTLARGALPAALETDVLLSRATLCEREGDYASAAGLLARLKAIERGGLGGAYLAQLQARVDFGLGRYDASERMCRRLIRQGYEADNRLRLGRIYKARGDFARAAEAYRAALRGIGLREEDLESDLFPLRTSSECDAFSATMGLAECLLALGDSGAAAPVLRRAARLRQNSPRPCLGFGRLFLAAGDLEKAGEAFTLALSRVGLPPGGAEPQGEQPEAEAEEGLSEVCERSGRAPEAWEHACRALAACPTHRRALLRARRLAGRLGRREDLAAIYERLLAWRPGDVEALAELAALKRDLGRPDEARRLAERALLLGGAPAGAGRPAEGARAEGGAARRSVGLAREVLASLAADGAGASAGAGGAG